MFPGKESGNISIYPQSCQQRDFFLKLIFETKIKKPAWCYTSIQDPETCFQYADFAIQALPFLQTNR